MKTTTIIIFFLLSVSAFAQLDPSPRIEKTRIGGRYEPVKTIDAYKIGTAGSDTTIYYLYKEFDRVKDQLNDYWVNMVDTTWHYTKNYRIAVKGNLSLEIQQRIDIWVNKEIELSADGKLIYYIKEAQNMNVTPTQFWNYVLPKLETTNDSIQ